MNTPEQKLIAGMKIWAFVLIGLCLFYNSKKRKCSGLTFIFVYDLAINHLFGAAIYLLPWYMPRHQFLLGFTSAQVASGFLQASYGLVGFFLGNVILTPGLYKIFKSKPLNPQSLPSDAPKRLIAVGVFFYFLLKPLKGLPSLGTLSSSGWTFMQVGICLALWNTYRLKNKKEFIFWLLLGVTFFPVFTLVFQGFLGFAIKAILIIICFISVFYRPKWVLIIAAPLILYFGLTVFVNYLQARDEIRAAVWGGESLSARMEVVQRSFQKMEMFNHHNIDHLECIDLRLNQNYFVGSAIDYIDGGYKPFAHGETVVGAVAAMIPRVFWPNKPKVGGSVELMTAYTGLYFAEGTNFGVGIPLELYINFGTSGIIIGFMIFGMLIGWYDYQAGRALYEGDLSSFLNYFFPGLALTVTLSSLAEITSSFAAAYVFLFLVNVFFIKRQRKLSIRLSQKKISSSHPESGISNAQRSIL